MGYLHISNLYADGRILEFKNLFALEKIHGTSAHIAWKDGRVTFFSGGEKYERFVSLFDADALTATFEENFGDYGKDSGVTIYGEAYGGSQQGMSKVYGKDLKFIAFDVKIGDNWLSVLQANDVVTKLGLEFVSYTLISSDLFYVDAMRDQASVQALRNGITEPQKREGIVLRPPFEVTLNNGERLIAKHKTAEFCETKRPREVNPDKQILIQGAETIADEYVTAMRLEHVINSVVSMRENKEVSITDTGLIIKAMIEDVTREAGTEAEIDKLAQKAIGAKAAKMFKQRVTTI